MIKALAIITAIVWLTVQGELSAQGTLRDDLSGEDCPASCLLGIVPGITSKSELEAILTARNITFDAAPIGHGGLINYELNPGLASNYVANIPQSVGINVTDYGVEEIIVSLTNVSVSDIVNWYGAPSVIGNTGSPIMVYVPEGLAFYVSGENSNIVDLAILRSPGYEGGIRSYIDAQPCNTTSDVCALATATPIPKEQVFTLDGAAPYHSYLYRVHLHMTAK